MPEEELVRLSQRFGAGDFPAGADRKQIVGWSGVPDGIHRMWGPPIFKCTVPHRTVEALNTLIDQYCANAASLNGLNHAENLVGDTHQELLLPFRDVKTCGLLDIVQQAAWQFVSATWKPSDLNVTTGISLQHLTFWCVIARQHDFNPPHCHNGDLSGILWLRNPENMVASTKKWWGGLFSFCHSGQSKWETSVRTFYPTVGTLVLFPSYLTHVVTPFQCDGERRSLSFNAEVVLT